MYRLTCYHWHKLADVLELTIFTDDPILPNRNGNTSEYCFISGENISTTGMAILVSIAPLVERTSVQQEW